MNVEAAIFDIGNVLVLFDWGPAEEQIRLRTGNSTREARAALLDLKGRFELGHVSQTHFLCEAVRILDFQGGPDDLAAIWNSIFSANEVMGKLIARLKTSLPLYLLSNTSELHLAYLQKRFGILQEFADGIYSFRAGCAKPAREIFEIASRRFGVDRSRTIFVDDLAENVDSAADFGFQAIRYEWRAHSKFQKKLAAFGLLSDGSL